MISKNLLKLLKEKDISVLELSRETSIPTSTISSWANGTCSNLIQLDQVAQFLGTTIEFLTFDEKNSNKLISNQKKGIEGQYKVTIQKLHQ